MLEKSVEIDPQYARAWGQLGSVYAVNASLRFGGREQYAKAQAAYERALTIDPAAAEVRGFLADLLVDTNRVEEAVPLLREVLQINPDDALAHWELSYAYRFAGALDQSIAEGEQAHRLDPTFKLRAATFNTYIYTGQYEKFLATLPTTNDSALMSFYRGFAHYHLNQMPEAAANFDHAYQLDSLLLQAVIGKSLSLDFASRRDEGLRILRDAERRSADNGVADAEGIYKLAQAYAVLGDTDSALRTLRRSIEGGFFPYPYFVSDPLLSNIRRTPGCEALLEAARQRHEHFERRFFNAEHVSIAVPSSTQR